MPPRSTPPPKGSFYPPNDVATYRDLLLFEERLKSNATNLQRRKSRYQLFLLQLLVVIAFLLSEVLLPPQSSFLAIPYKMVLQQLLPEIYTPDVQVTIHPYFASGLLFVSVTTLVLFFASGMYSEKIAYANNGSGSIVGHSAATLFDNWVVHGVECIIMNAAFCATATRGVHEFTCGATTTQDCHFPGSYVPHANRALRSFNMYLNVRKPPLRSKFYLNPLSFFFPRPEEHPPANQSSSTPSTPRSRTPSGDPRAHSASPSAHTTLPIPSIPPASNPRGELIFSSRVDRSFRDAYERYRAAFERKREEKEREKALQTGWWRRFYKTPPVRGGSPLVGSAPPLRSTSSSSSGGGGTLGRKTASRSGTPPGGGIMMRQRERDRSGSPPVMQETPPGSGSPPHRDRERQRIRREGTGDDMRTFALERTLSHRGRAR
ncbi:hypothetical protein D9615_003114 [Tricholomella constricta]|uniref:Transmembrane protein 188 n=1 Tax=Tricholomella constricta TaxID=117010 RepID=A0A8H5HJS1_9AGAR|nr:hypothetical protein D9615_003114 [Tricholomella constricta]